MSISSPVVCPIPLAYVDTRPGSSRLCRPRKKSPIAQQRDEGLCWACGGGWLPASTRGGWCSWTSRGSTPPWSACAPGLRGGSGPTGRCRGSGPQPDAHRLHHPGGRRGRVGLDRGCHRLGALRELRRALPRADALFGSGGRARHSRGAQDAQGQGARGGPRGADLLFLPPYSPELNPIEIRQPQCAFRHKLSYHWPRRAARATGAGREARSRPYVRRRGGSAMSSRGAVPPRP
jgi:hypothetical protein